MGICSHKTRRIVKGFGAMSYEDKLKKIRIFSLKRG